MPQRRAFTLVELLVVLGIIGLLMAMILPAVQSSRESARQTECLNKIRQVGIALQNYHTLKHVYPAGAIARADPASAGSPHTSARWSALVMLLPYLEQKPVFDQLQLELPLYSGLGVNPVHAGKISAIIPEFLCSSNPYDNLSFGFGPTNYAVCTGSGSNLGSPFDTDGIFGINSATKDAHIQDGLSKTALVSESTLGTRGTFSGATQALAATDYAYSLVVPMDPAVCANAKQFNESNPRGFSWANGEYRTTLYNHYYDPNSESFDCIGNQLAGGKETRLAVHGWRAARSAHRNVVGIVMADTSTKSVPDTVDLTVWQAWSTRKGGETVPAE